MRKGLQTCPGYISGFSLHIKQRIGFKMCTTHPWLDSSISPIIVYLTALPQSTAHTMGEHKSCMTLCMTLTILYLGNYGTIVYKGNIVRLCTVFSINCISHSCLNLRRTGMRSMIQVACTLLPPSHRHRTTQWLGEARNGESSRERSVDILCPPPKWRMLDVLNPTPILAFSVLFPIILPSVEDPK